jgi:siderophore synthetase component
MTIQSIGVAEIKTFGGEITHAIHMHKIFDIRVFNRLRKGRRLNFLIFHPWQWHGTCTNSCEFFPRNVHV